MAICDFRPDATNIPNTCMSKTNMEGERKCLGPKENNVFNQPDGLSLYREVKKDKRIYIYIYNLAYNPNQ